MEKLTAAQQKTLESLRRQQAAGWTPSKSGREFVTGCNTTTIRSLRNMGLVKVGWLFLNGLVSTDIEVVN